MRFFKVLPLFFILYAVQTEVRSSEILDLGTSRTFASKALSQILTTLDQRIEIDTNNLKNIKALSQQRNAKEKTAKLFEYLEIAELKDLGENLLNMSLALATINQASYESALTHGLIGQTANFCSKMITDKIKEYVTLAVKLRKTQQESSQEAIETIIKEMYVSHLKECKTTPNTASAPYFSIAWDQIFAMAPSPESHLLFDLEVIREIMNNHAICSREHDIVAIIPSVFIYFQESILTTSERSRTIPKQDSITILMQERTNIFNRYSETIVKLASDQACAFLLNCGGILRSLQEACQDINKQIEDVYSRSRTAYKEKSVSGS